MEYLNISIIKTMQTPEFMDAGDEERGVWIALLGYCCTQENGGVIHNCRVWSDRIWLQSCGTSSERVNLVSGLYYFVGDDLVVFGYPKNIQDQVISKRETSRRNGANGGRPPGSGRKGGRSGNSDVCSVETHDEPEYNLEETQREPDDNLGLSCENLTITEANPDESGRERKGKEGNGIYTPDGVSPERTGAKRSVGRKDTGCISGGGIPVPEDVEEVRRYLRNEVACGRLRLLPVDVDSVADKFFYNALKREWRDSKDIPIRNWKAAASQEGIYQAERRSIGGAGLVGVVSGVDPLASYNKLN